MKLGDALKYARYANPDTARRFRDHMTPHVVRPVQVIWNKAIGALFGVMAFTGFAYAARHSDNPAALLLAGFFGSVMLFFCISSFLRARRISRM